MAKKKSYDEDFKKMIVELYENKIEYSKFFFWSI